MAQVSKKFNAVERDQILTELIKKEERQARLSEVFTGGRLARMQCGAYSTAAA